MAKPMITIHDIATGEVIEREMTAEEFEQYNADKVEAEAHAAAQATKAALRQATLQKLGLTAEEVAALLA